MRALVLGGTGMLGKAVAAHGAAGRRRSGPRRTARPTSPIASGLSSGSHAFRPELIVNCAAFTQVDRCEAEREKALAVNGRAVANVVAAAEGAGPPDPGLERLRLRRRCRGSLRGEAATGPRSVYGESKLEGRGQALRYERSLVVRASWLFGPGGANFVATIRRLWPTSEEPLRVVDDQIGCPTYTPFLARALWDSGALAARGRRTLLAIGEAGLLAWLCRRRSPRSARRSADVLRRIHRRVSAPRAASGDTRCSTTKRFEDAVGRSGGALGSRASTAYLSYGRIVMKALITGITGFAGSHLADYLLAHHPQVEVFGIRRWRSRMENLAHLAAGSVELVETDLKDYNSVYRLLEKARPDYIFHLAAQSYVPASWNAPAATLETNIIGQTNLFEAVRALSLDPTIQIACSSEEYGLVHPDETPITESNPLRPLSTYAVSKIAQDYLGYQYLQSYGLKVVRTRGFNHTGPRRGEVFVASNFAKQLARIKAGLDEPVIRVGNLEATRDFTDVRDMVRAYWLAVTRRKPGEVYNIASGREIVIQDLLDKLIELTDVEVTVERDPERMRPSDVEILLGDSSKFRQATGWEPLIPFDQTLSDLLDYWRQQIRSGAERIAH